MRRTWRFLVPTLLVTVLAWAWLEPTHCVRGWLYGEAFYQGRPTSYWRAELQQLTAYTVHMRNHAADGVIEIREQHWVRQSPFWDAMLPASWQTGRRQASRPDVLSGDSGAEEVLRELLDDPQPGVGGQARQCLDRIRTAESAQ